MVVLNGMWCETDSESWQEVVVKRSSEELLLVGSAKLMVSGESQRNGKHACKIAASAKKSAARMPKCPYDFVPSVGLVCK